MSLPKRAVGDLPQCNCKDLYLEIHRDVQVACDRIDRQTVCCRVVLALSCNAGKFIAFVGLDDKRNAAAVVDGALRLAGDASANRVHLHPVGFDPKLNRKLLIAGDIFERHLYRRGFLTYQGCLFAVHRIACDIAALRRFDIDSLVSAVLHADRGNVAGTVRSVAHNAVACLGDCDIVALVAEARHALDAGDLVLFDMLGQLVGDLAALSEH